MTRFSGARGLDRQSYCAERRSFNVRVATAAALLAALVALAGVAPARGGEPAVVLALGDSLTAGYGLPADKSFPAQLEAALIERGRAVRVINGGVSGDTSAGGLARVDWLLAEQPDLVIVELGANDGLRGLDPAVTRDNLDRILTRIRRSGARVLLTGMRAPPNLGQAYGREFYSMYTDLAEAHDVPLYPFFLEGVAADPALNLADGIHPTAEGIAIIVERIVPMVLAALDGAGR